MELADTTESEEYIGGEETEGIEETEETEEENPSFIDALFTAEGMSMMLLAVIVDIAEIILDLTGVGAIVALILDILAFVIIGGWMMMRGSDVKVSRKAAETLKKTTKEQFAQVSTKAEKWAKRLKWMRPVMPMFELIPFVSIVPCWIVAVYFELKHGTAS